MAQDFENVKARNIGTSASTLITSNSDDAIIGVRVANVVTQTIAVDVYNQIQLALLTVGYRI